jgi:cell fate (sporulation/competence/biofilm development) regulator YmcA (YheA/YmcA/DUF963 family)
MKLKQKNAIMLQRISKKKARTENAKCSVTAV